MLIALTREVSQALGSCELTHLLRAPIDVATARAEHESYEQALGDAGCVVRRVAPAPELPDSVFIEDVAVVFDEVAVITRPGAASRRAETIGVAAALSEYRTIRFIEEPGTLDGGDVLVIGTRVYVGRSGRSNGAGIDQLRELLAPSGYSVSPVTVSGCLHLKSAVTAVADHLVLINPKWVRPSAFLDVDFVDVHQDEPFAANALRIGNRIVYPTAFPRTRNLLERRGLDVRTVATGELAKAEGAVTCCSLLFEQR
jgi:dimethylargininase